MNHRRTVRPGPWLTLAFVAILGGVACDGSNGPADPDAQAPDVADPGSDAADPGPADLPADLPGDLPVDVPVDLPSDPAGDPSPDGGEDLPADAPDVPTQPAPHPLFDFVGGVRVTEYFNPDYPSSMIDVYLNDKASSRVNQRSAAQGDCELWVAKASFPTCTPECDFDHYCGESGTCVAMPVRIGMGSVTVTALGGNYTFVPNESGWYEGPSSLPADLFDPAMSVRVKADGDTVPAFERTLAGVGDMVLDLPDGTVTLVNGKDNELAWTPANDGSTVEMALQTGWHGRPPESILWCAAPDATGKIVMPAALVEGVGIMTGGPSLFQHPSWVRRVRRTVVDTSGGPAEIAVFSQVGVGLIHNAK